jgi:hypothetical protein
MVNPSSFLLYSMHDVYIRMYDTCTCMFMYTLSHVIFGGSDYYDFKFNFSSVVRVCRAIIIAHYSRMYDIARD